MTILMIVIGLAYGAIINSIGTQSRQEANVSAQAKLRRVVEVLSQDVRSAVFGSIIDQPFVSSDTQASFMLLTGGAGYSLTRYSLGETHVDVVGAVPGVAAGRNILLVNQQGRGQLIGVTAVTPGSGSRSGTTRLTLNCGVSVPYTNEFAPLIFDISTLGIRFDEADEQLYVITDSWATEAPFAFDITDFRLEYVYTATDAEPLVRNQPHREGGLPTRSFTDGGNNYSLARLQIIIASEAVTRSGVTPHIYTAQIDLMSHEDFSLKELTSCI